MIELTRDEIDYTALTERVRSTQSGAVVLFLGTVREMTGGRQTLALDYDAYPEMAGKYLSYGSGAARRARPEDSTGKRLRY